MKFYSSVLTDKHGNVTTDIKGNGIKALVILTARKLASKMYWWYRTLSTSRSTPYQITTKRWHECVYIPAIRSSPQDRWKTHQTTAVFGSKCQAYFKRRGEKRNVSLSKVTRAPGRITIIRFALLVSDNLFRFPARGSNIFVCYFEIGAPPQRPRTGTRKDLNYLSLTNIEVCLMGIEMELYLRKLKKGRRRWRCQRKKRGR